MSRPKNPVVGPEASSAGTTTGQRGDWPRGLKVTLAILVAVVVVSTSIQMALLLVVVPQEIRNAQPVFVGQSTLISLGPVTCFQNPVLSPAGMFPQGAPFTVVWNIVPLTNESTCTISSFDLNRSSAPSQIVSSNLPIKFFPGVVEASLAVDFGPVTHPYSGSISLIVVSTNP